MTQIRVDPKLPNPSHEIALSTKHEKWGMKLDGGIRGIQELSETPSTLLTNQAGQKWGDFDPNFAHIQQDTWYGGRGQEDFLEDESRYYSGQYIWPLTPNVLHQAPLWKWADGDYRDYNMHQPGSVSWQILRNTTRYYASKFTVDALDDTSYDADKAYILLRRRGNPGTLTVEVWSDSDGSPSAKVGSWTKTATTSNITDTVSLWYAFEPASAETLTHATAYWVVVYGASTDSAANHWEVAVDESGSASKYSTAGSSWTAAGTTMYYRVVDADAAQKWHGFFLYTDAGAFTMCAVNEPASGNSDVFTWDETNDEWDAVGTIAGDDLSGIVQDVAVHNNIAYFARGTSGSDTLYQFYDASATWTGYDDTTAANEADYLAIFNDPTDGPQLYRAENDNCYISRANVPAAGADASFGDDIKLPQGYDILKLCVYNDKVWARTTNALHSIDRDTPSELPVGLGAILEATSYDAPMIAENLFLFFGWAFSVERLYGGTLDDVGPWKDAGLPDGFQGGVSALAPGIGMMLVGVDGGSSNTSSVLAATEHGYIYHPLWQAWESGQRVRNLWVQPSTSSNNMRLWISVGTDMCYIELPDESLNPLRDSSQEFCWEGVIETSAFPISYSLPKLYKEFVVTSRNLGGDDGVGKIGIDFQFDDDVGSTDAVTWIPVTELYRSPRDTAELNLGNAENIRLRLRMNTSSSTTPTLVLAYVLKGIARTPAKRRWNLKVKIDSLKCTRVDAQDPREFYKWVRKMANSAEALLMEAEDELMHNVYVFVEPPSFFRSFYNTIKSWLGGTVALTLREA